MIHLRVFDTTTEYNLAKNNLVLPNVSLCKDDLLKPYYNPYDPYNGYEYVDLGLSVKWAKCNIGATKEEEYGLYFQWGDTQGYTNSQVGNSEGQKYFGSPDYKYSNNGGHTAADMTKYNRTDGKTVLEASDDAATANMGGSWRMPTEAEFNELITTVNTTSEWTTVNGVYGFKFTSKKSGYTDKYVFFPAAGRCYSGKLDGKGGYGFVWSSTLKSSDTINGKNLYFYNGNKYVRNEERQIGCPVRGVIGE